MCQGGVVRKLIESVREHLIFSAINVDFSAASRQILPNTLNLGNNLNIFVHIATIRNEAQSKQASMYVIDRESVIRNKSRMRADFLNAGQ